MLDYIGYGLFVVILVWFAYRMFAPVKGLKTLHAEQFAKAINLPLSQIKSRLTEIPKQTPEYLYCKSGMRSKQAAGILAKNGYTEIIHLLDELDRSKEIYAYCQVGVRGYIASRILQQQGFDVKNLTGGYRTYDIARFTPAVDY